MDDDFSDLEYTPQYNPGMDDEILPENVDQLPQEDMTGWLDDSGLDFPWLDGIKSAWQTGTDFVKENPGITSMITSGIGNAQKNQYSAENLAQMNQYRIDAEQRGKADAAELWERRNQSVINTKMGSGLIGGGALTGHTAYLKGRK